MHLLKEVLSFAITYISASNKSMFQKFNGIRETCKASVLMCHLISRVSRMLINNAIRKVLQKGMKATLRNRHRMDIAWSSSLWREPCLFRLLQFWWFAINTEKKYDGSRGWKWDRKHKCSKGKELRFKMPAICKALG